MARATGSASTEETRTTDDGTKVIARNPALRAAPKTDVGPVDEQGRFTGHDAKGLTWERRWTTPGVHPYDEITWELRSAEIKNESSFVDDLGADSLDTVELVMALEEEFECEIPDEEAEKITTVQLAIDYAVKHQKA